MQGIRIFCFVPTEGQSVPVAGHRHTSKVGKVTLLVSCLAST